MIKILKEYNDEIFIEFTPEELVQLELNLGDEFTCTLEEGKIILKKTKTAIDIDLELYSKDELLNLIQYMNKNDYTFSQAIVSFLNEIIKTPELLKSND